MRLFVTASFFRLSFSLFSPEARDSDSLIPIPPNPTFFLCPTTSPRVFPVSLVSLVPTNQIHRSMRYRDFRRRLFFFSQFPFLPRPVALPVPSSRSLPRPTAVSPIPLLLWPFRAPPSSSLLELTFHSRPQSASPSQLSQIWGSPSYAPCFPPP